MVRLRTSRSVTGWTKRAGRLLALALAGSAVLGACTPSGGTPTATPAAVATKPAPAPTAASAASPAAQPSPAVAASPSPAAVAKPARPTGPPATLKLASGVGVFRSGLDIGLERGYYKEENLDVDLVSIETGPDQLPFMASGQLDVLFSGPSAAHFNALAADVPVRFVASCGNSSPTGREGNTLLVVRKDLYDSGQLRELKDLKGKRFAIPNLQSKGYADAFEYLRKGGLQLSDVTFVAPISFQEMVVGLANKAIDAAITLEPFVTQAANQGVGVVLAGDEQILTNRLGCAVVFGQRLVQDRDLGKRFLRAYLRSVRDYNDAFFKNQGKADIVKILVDKYPVKDPALYDRMYPFSVEPNGRISVPSIELDVRFYRQQGLVTVEPNVQALVDATLAREVVAELGEYR